MARITTVILLICAEGVYQAVVHAGLVLAIAMAIAPVHRGTIEVKSFLHQGSTFTVKLPKP